MIGPHLSTIGVSHALPEARWTLQKWGQTWEAFGHVVQVWQMKIGQAQFVGLVLSVTGYGVRGWLRQRDWLVIRSGPAFVGRPTDMLVVVCPGMVVFSAAVLVVALVAQYTGILGQTAACHGATLRDGVHPGAVG